MISRKLRSQAGASLIAALFLFLLCAMAGSTILAAATANAGRLANRRTENQAYYKTVSAARLFAEGFEGKKVQITWKKTDYLDGSPTYDGWTVMDASSVPDKFSELLRTSIEEIYGASPSSTVLENYWKNDFSAAKETSVVKGFTVTLKDVAGTEVYGRIALQSLKGKIRAVFSSKPIEDIPPAERDSNKPNIIYKVADSAYLIRLDREADVSDPVVTTQYFVANPDDPTHPTEAPDGGSYDFRIDTKTITFEWSDVKIREG